MVPWIWVNTGTGNGLLPEGTKPLPEPMLTWDHWHPSQCNSTENVQGLVANFIVQNKIFEDFNPSPRGRVILSPQLWQWWSFCILLFSKGTIMYIMYYTPNIYFVWPMIYIWTIQIDYPFLPKATKNIPYCTMDANWFKFIIWIFKSKFIII